CSRQNSLLMATMANPRYCSPRSIWRSKSSPIRCKSCLVRVRLRSRVSPKRRASARTRSRSSRVSGTTFRWAVLGRRSFFSALVSTAVATVASSQEISPASVRLGVCRGGGEFASGPSEGRHGEDYRVKLLEVPQLGKVKPNGRGGFQAAGFHLLDEPGEAL